MSRLTVQLLVPDDPDIDLFDSGNSEVDEFFRRRKWFSASKQKSSPPTYRFGVTENGTDLVGLVAMAPRKSSHPNDNSVDKELYLVIYAIGVDTKFHGRKLEEKSLAVNIFEHIENFARSLDDCVGVSLWVRSDNARAIAFYEKVGMVKDPGGPVSRDQGATHLTMRKTF